jgi:hypothetical protein
MSEYTPTPWVVDEDGTLSRAGVGLFNSILLRSPWREDALEGDPTALANAEFIVLAVNAHAELVRALKTARRALSTVSEYDAVLAVATCDAAIAKAGADQ